eukprot:3330026-Amphidinium_carterae.1
MGSLPTEERPRNVPEELRHACRVSLRAKFVVSLLHGSKGVYRLENTTALNKNECASGADANIATPS